MGGQRLCLDTAWRAAAGCRVECVAAGAVCAAAAAAAEGAASACLLLRGGTPGPEGVFDVVLITNKLQALRGSKRGNVSGAKAKRWQQDAAGCKATRLLTWLIAVFMLMGTDKARGGSVRKMKSLDV